MRTPGSGEIRGVSLDAAGRAAWRAERRGVARQHHPDVGGDLQEYLRATAEIDRRYGVGPKVATNAPGTRSRTGVRTDRRSQARRSVRTCARRTRALSKTIRSRLPRWVPGARRYTQIGPGRPIPGRPPSPSARTAMGSDSHSIKETHVTTSTVGLLAGLLLGVAAAAGGFFGFLIALVLGVVGYLVGGHYDGEVDLSKLMGGRRRG